MQRFVYTLILTSLLACQTVPVRDSACLKDADRNPANLSCKSLFQNHTPPEKTAPKEVNPFNAPELTIVDKAINDLSKFGKAGERWTYIEIVESQYRLETGEPSVQIGRELLKRRQLGESTASILTKLGFREQYGYLLPPRNLALVYQRLYKMLLESAQAAGVDRKDVILPAFVFQNRENHNEIIFISPGIDPLPDPARWKLPTYIGELNVNQFSEMVKQRKFILEPYMFSHDIGHFVDLIERPLYHVTYRKYVEARLSLLNSHESPNGVLNFGLFDKHTDQIINEWIYLPHKKNQDFISKIIPEFNPNKIQSLEELTQKYRQMPTNELIQLAQKFVKSRYQLFSGHGGATRDTSFERFRQQSNINNAFIERIKGASEDVYWVKDRPDLPPVSFEPEKSIDLFLKYQAPSLFERLSMTLDPEPQSDMRSVILMAATKIGKEGDIEAGRHEIIATHLAEIENRIQSALFYNLQPEQIARDMTYVYKNEVKKYIDSPTYKYFSTYPIGSAPRYLFVDRFSSNN